MKNIILLFVFASTFMGAVAQSSEVDNVFVYSLPKTVLFIEVEIEKTTQTPGSFYQYSERYLATKDVITEARTFHRLKGIKIWSESFPDINRTYTTSLNDKKTAMHNFVINEKGILCGVNTDYEGTTPTPKQPLLANIQQATKAEADLLPMGEDYMMVSSVAKLAEGAAKQIYRIRDNRLNFLAGDVDNYPADGDLFLSLMSQMDKKEKQLTELFSGKTVSETQTQLIQYDPKSPKTNEILFRLSALGGLVSSNDLSGYPYYINITTTSLQFTQTDQPSKSKSATILRTIQPASSQIKITDGKNEYFSGDFDIPQFGPIVSISNDVLKDGNVKIDIDPQTGRLLSIKSTQK